MQKFWNCIPHLPTFALPSCRCASVTVRSRNSAIKNFYAYLPLMTYLGCSSAQRDFRSDSFLQLITLQGLVCELLARATGVH